MSKIGLKPLDLKNAKIVERKDDCVKISGIEGEIIVDRVPSFISFKVENEVLYLDIEDKDDLVQKKMWGTTASRLENALNGVRKKFSRTVEVVGNGFAISLKERVLEFKIGYSHIVPVKLPEGMEIITKINTKTKTINSIELKHVDKQLLNNFVSHLEMLRSVNPYSGKGVHADGKTYQRKSANKK